MSKAKPIKQKITLPPPNLVTICMIERKWGSLDNFMASFSETGKIKIEDAVYLVGLIRNQDKNFLLMPKEEAEAIIMNTAMEFDMTNMTDAMNAFVKSMESIAVKETDTLKKTPKSAEAGTIA